jgi:hypothetical protein
LKQTIYCHQSEQVIKSNHITAIMTEQDISNMESLGEWDHGVEPSVLDASRKQGNDTSSPLLEGSKRLAKDAQVFLSKAIHDLTDSVSNTKESFQKDKAFNKKFADHTEEEVAGMKLCVSKTVHQDSFVAPCYNDLCSYIKLIAYCIHIISKNLKSSRNLKCNLYNNKANLQGNY